MIVLTYTKPSNEIGRGGVSIVGLFETLGDVGVFLRKRPYVGDYTQGLGLQWGHEDDPGHFNGYECTQYNGCHLWARVHSFDPVTPEMPVSEKLRNAIPSIDYYHEEATKYDPPSSVGFGDEGSRIIWQGVEAIQYGVYWRLMNQRGRKRDHSSALTKARTVVEKVRKIFLP